MWSSEEEEDEGNNASTPTIMQQVPAKKKKKKRKGKNVAPKRNMSPEMRGASHLVAPKVLVDEVSRDSMEPKGDDTIATRPSRASTLKSRRPTT